MLLKKSFVILFIICSSQYSSCFLTVLSLVKNGWKFALFLNDVWFTKDTALGVYGLIVGENPDTEITNKLDSIHKDLEDLTMFTRDRFNDLELLMDTLSDKIKIDRLKENVLPFMIEVRNHWENFFRHRKNRSGNETFDLLVDSIFKNIGDRMTVFRSSIAPTTAIGQWDALFMAIARYSSARRNIDCGKSETFHQTLTGILEVVLSYEAMAQNLMTFAISWRYKELTGRSTELLSAVRVSKEQLRRYLAEYVRALKIGETPFLRACDGPWERNKTFIEFEKYIQQTLIRGRANNIWGTCERDPKSKSFEEFDKRTSCYYLMENCEEVKSVESPASACIYREGPYRIKFVRNYTELRSACHPDIYFGGNSEIVSGSGSLCNCQCHSNMWKIVTGMTQSRMRDNYVVVGIQLRRRGRTLYIQIAEGKLGANGHISNSTWVSPTRDPEVLSTTEVLDKWNGFFFFDDLQLPPGHALTGIHFVYQPERYPHVHGFGIRISGVQFDYETGQLNLRHPSFVMTAKREPQRGLGFRARSSIDMNPYDPHRIDSDGYTHIRIEQSEQDSDFGQSSLPLLDSSGIFSSPLSPMGGVGLFHKGLRDWAGFMAFRMYPVNYTYFLNEYLKTYDVDSLIA